MDTNRHNLLAIVDALYDAREALKSMTADRDHWRHEAEDAKTQLGTSRDYLSRLADISEASRVDAWQAHDRAHVRIADLETELADAKASLDAAHKVVEVPKQNPDCRDAGDTCQLGDCTTWIDPYDSRYNGLKSPPCPSCKAFYKVAS